MLFFVRDGQEMWACLMRFMHRPSVRDSGESVQQVQN
jgi:hypothetical protein